MVACTFHKLGHAFLTILRMFHIYTMRLQILVEPVCLFAVAQAMDMSTLGPGVAAVMTGHASANAEAMLGLHLLELEFISVLPMDGQGNV